MPFIGWSSLRFRSIHESASGFTVAASQLSIYDRMQTKVPFIVILHGFFRECWHRSFDVTSYWLHLQPIVKARLTSP